MTTFEVSHDEETGITIVTIHDVPAEWTYRHEYGRLEIIVPPKTEEKG